MRENIMFIPAVILMVVEAIALGFLVWASDGYMEALDNVETVIREFPTLDAVEVVHGEWEFGELGPLGADVRCSNCGWVCENVDPILWVTYPGHKFCGACGAKMDGDGNDI